MKIIYILLSLLIISSLCLVSCSKKANDQLPLKTVSKVDLSKYAGTWYEIALLPNSFEKGCRCTKATYTLKGDYVQVENSCVKGKKKKVTVAKGKAWPTDATNSKLKVRFFWPFKGDYWIVYLDKHYQYAVVGVPSRKHLWFLSRKPKMTLSVYGQLLDIAREQGFDVSKLTMTDQACYNTQ